ncbi:MAG: zinc metallopeptidase [Clostridia bacterium]|nr:zinc metallopeptidase [Clostridia bacterium]
MIPALIITVGAQIYVKSTYSKYSKIPSPSGMSGYESARLVLESGNCSGVAITPGGGELTDNYNPQTNVISLSGPVYSERSIASVAVAAHEAGHALQHAEGYFPIKVRTAIIPVTRIGSILSWPLVILGILFSFRPLALAGVIFFAACVLFQLVTLPVEINASKRALAVLSSAADGETVAGARKVLTAAALTYVAALATSVLQMLRLLALVSRSSKR